MFLGMRGVRLSSELQRSMVLMNFLRKYVIGTALGLFVGRMGLREHFSGQGLRERRDRRNYRGVRLGAMAVVIVLEVFENVADVQEGVAIEPNVHERGLHTREHACDPALVDATNQRELFLALDINFD